VARGDVEALCSELEIIDAPTGAILAADHLAMMATVIGFRANATAIAVPSLSPWRSVGGKQQRQERVAANLGGPDPVVADSFGRRHLIGDAGQIGAAGTVDRAADVAIHPHRAAHLSKRRRDSPRRRPRRLHQFRLPTWR
jgi:hypothetical protein